jgi:hypothetical protein
VTTPVSGVARPHLAFAVVGTLVAVKLGPYEFHRDEFLYMAMGEHLRLFRMDFPPFIAMLSEIARGLLGDSLFAVRFFPALFSAGVMVLAALIAREFGGGRFAQGLAALCVLCSPLFMRSGTLFQPVVFDQFWWTLGLYALVRWSKQPEPRWWLVFGAACGLGLLSKFSVLVFGLAVLLALVVTPARRALKTPWPWVAAAMAFIIGSPSIIGQIRLGLPILDQMGDLRSAQLARVTPFEFVIEHLLWNPVAGVVLLAGLAALVGSKRFRPFGLVGWSCLWALILLVVLRGKPYYAGPVHATLFAAGAVVLDGMRIPRWGAVLRWGAVTAVVAWGMLTLPLGFPVLPPSRMEAYVNAIGDEGARTTNVGEIERLPQDYADMLGWREFVAAVANVYHGLPAADREQAVILTSNYGEAGAIDFYGPEHGLPKAVAVVGTYWFFGPGDKPGDVTVVIGFGREEIGGRFSTLDSAAYWTHPYMVAEQRNLTFFVGRKPEETLQEIWPRFEGAQ